MFKLSSVLLSLLSLLFLSNHVNSQNMNGDLYQISNPNQTSTIQYSAIFSNISSTAKYFDVYSLPITSQYGEVYWTMMGDVNLPSNVIKQYQNKTMAIIGYEMDQVFKTENGDVSVPITWAYNHHYEAYLVGSNAEIVDIEFTNDSDLGEYNHGAKKTWKILEGEIHNNIPNSQFFSEGNGGESRGSFHGYAKNMAQLIRSPSIFKLQPMQIDTRNRSPKYINNSIFHSGILPKHSAAPDNASYSGLLECPCTTRINKTIIHNYKTIANNICSKCVTTPLICYQESLKLGGTPLKNVTSANVIKSNALPHGCSFTQNIDNQITSINYNIFDSKVNCGSNSKRLVGNTNFNIEKINITINIDLTKEITEQLEMTIAGPSNLWFGVAFNAYLMNDLPYSIIVNGNGSVFEYKLGNHILGNLLKPSIKIVSNNVQNGFRTIVLTRTLKGLTSDYFSFNNQTTIPLLAALGYSGNIAYHHLKSSNAISINALDGDTCVCDDGSNGFINGIPFSKRCAPEPTADLLQQKNPTCFIETYQGGLSCCHHKNVLLDADQIQPEDQMTYHLKFRFWYEDYKNHNSLIRLYFQTEAYAGEYDIPKCTIETPPEECVHSITARWQAKNMVSQSDIDYNKTLRLAYAGPHCHAPSCISMELYNDDTGELICGVNGILGSGNSNQKFDEKGYIKLNPCVWGFDDGLLQPPILQWNTNLSSIKKNNNTYAHYGEMASWQMRGYLV